MLCLIARPTQEMTPCGGTSTERPLPLGEYQVNHFTVRKQRNVEEANGSHQIARVRNGTEARPAHISSNTPNKSRDGTEMMLLSFQDIVSLWMKTKNVFTRCDLVLAALNLYSGRTL
jgi:hypothetical protein